MMKSYVESGGTVLSTSNGVSQFNLTGIVLTFCFFLTDWEDVGKKKVEVSPPDGMVARKWGTDEVIAEGGEKKKREK